MSVVDEIGADRLAGLVLLSSREELEIDAFRSALVEGFAGLRASLGDDVVARVSVRFDVDPLAAVYGERAMGEADAIIDISAPLALSLGEVADRLGALRALQPLLASERCALGIGRLVSIQPDDRSGREVLSFLGRRAPEITQEAMSRWWRFEHAALVKRLQDGRTLPWSYGQLHVDHDASIRAAASAGFPVVEYDMGDVLAISDRKAFLDFHTAPEAAAALAEDEVGHLDQTSWRGGLMAVIADGGSGA